MAESSDGFAVAQRDLEIRGAGELLGTRQSGVPELALADLPRDGALLVQAQADARAIVAQDPTLASPAFSSLARALEERWAGRLRLARVG
jgi:ATP-dependent DNA helicase RecG